MPAIAMSNERESEAARPVGSIGRSPGMGLLTGGQVGRYKVLTLAGAGGMGEVYAGHDPLLNRPVAIKRHHLSQTEEDRRADRLLKEASLHGRLQHPNIVSLYDFVTHDGTSYIISEYVDGESLRVHLEHGRPSYRQALVIMLGIARGLAAAHSNGVVHRDLKTENVLIASDGAVKLIDFGLSRSLVPVAGFHTRGSEVGALIGTFQCMSPEQSRGENVDARSDLFSLGIIAYELFAGRSPFEAENVVATLESIRHKQQQPLRRVAPEVPSALSMLVDQLLTKDPHGRPASAVEVVEVVEPLAQAANRAPAGDRTRYERIAVVHLAARATAAATAHSLGAFHTLLREATGPHGADVVYAAGEEALVCIGLGETYENNTRAAAAFVAEVFARARQRLDTSLEVAAALDVGELTVQTFDQSRLLLGPPVTHAMRLGRTARAGELLASPAAHLPLRRYYRMEAREAPDAGPSAMAYRIVARQSVEGSSTRFVGRDHELALLHRAWQAVGSSGIGAVVGLEGEAGIGKSRLVHQFVTDPAFEGRVIVARANPTGLLTPFRVFRNLFGKQSRTDLRDNLRAPTPRLEELVAAAALVTASADPPDEASLRRLERDRGGDALANTFAQYLLGIAEEHPLLVVVEDFHWADPSSCVVVEELARQAHAVPLMLLVTYRAEELRPRFPADAERIVLRGLATSEAARIFAECLGEAALEAVAVDRYLAFAHGVPLWLEEMAAEVGAQVARGAAVGESIPPSLRDHIPHRLQTVPPAARETARLLAALGGQAPADLLLCIAGRTRAERNADIEALVRRGLVHHRGAVSNPRLAFRHELVRDAIYASIAEDDRHTLHGLIAAALEGDYAADHAVRPETLAHHLELSGDAERAVQCWREAASWAASIFSHDVACRHYERALGLLQDRAPTDDRAQLERNLRIAYRRSLQLKGGLYTRDIGENDRRLAELGGVRGAAEHWMAFLQAYLTCSMEAIDAVDSDLAVRVEVPLMRYLLLTTRGMANVHRGRLSQARRDLAEAAAMRDEVFPAIVSDVAEETTLIVAPAVYLAWAELLAGDVDAALGHHVALERRFSPDSAVHLNSLAMGAVALTVAGSFDESIARTERVIAEGAGKLAPGHIFVARFLRLYVRMKRNEGAELRVESLRELRACFEGWQKGIFLASSLIYPTLIIDVSVDILERGDAEPGLREEASMQAGEMLRWAENALELPGVEEMHVYFTPELYRVVARLAAVQGDQRRAEASLAEARRRADHLEAVGGVRPRFFLNRIERTAQVDA